MAGPTTKVHPGKRKANPEATCNGKPRIKGWSKEAIIDSGDDITADRLKNAAATKKLAIFDAFEILNRIQEEENLLEGKAHDEKVDRVFKGFAEGRSK